MGLLNGLATIIAMLTFLGIVVWAFSKGRADANREASMLPFAVPDERLMDKKKEETHE
ncbi:cbb3-type cytochrome oxidase subunit 3 [Pollutimonas thiosulfatoxidans]|uniref:CcoQ/FixQ family Cbb3-type cytochrome c oxidase assembly chaperone n=1 Tax=Pollutimonas thiosulfatoxidans TaxID=2028345 RepID=A0A410GBE2_9BURK|nr:CcoQ/FixQ family Cbb3-type cytochrome c oxidase assembly chaperone [Pollutimonas thiosulfatoxidans]MBF6617397.1 CcoQ/FixQ family Cbb3-type cytochrome c oxidase assembly chaperone [Candidimonas sp.]NYT46196.1 CcoQ/FixQ family Cbb3-type cytochrome c oxidase assembly chaperone [Alcaligenaceae bacterium]QAA93615.1 CcoQ/FixQ family Cbb3-type cytochrome c oxidase assembly chaperone [Pollutimonas thiosulfatoxidans]